jgi:hypothetical protein
MWELGMEHGMKLSCRWVIVAAGARMTCVGIVQPA